MREALGMAKRMCDGCRFFEKLGTQGEYGNCRLRPPVDTDLPAVSPDDWCGEWRDKHVTPEQEQRQELVRRFAVAMVGTEWCYNPGARNFTPNQVWGWAEELADAEPPSNP